jgi:hypothetical protein
VTHVVGEVRGRPCLIIDDMVSTGGMIARAVETLTLLIVGGADDVVLELNEQALAQLRCPKELVVIPGANHLFPEPGALEKVSRLAARWFLKYLGGPVRSRVSPRFHRHEPQPREGTMATRHLRTRPEWEDALRGGRKTIDARPVADDIAGLQLGDVVHYAGARARVGRLRFYPGFGDPLAHEDSHRIVPAAASRAEVLQRLEAGHGVTVRATGALELEPIGDGEEAA